MNYLAHLLLAENTAESRIGNLLGDFVKGKLEQYETCYSQEIIKGIKLHREIDRFTDTHAIYIGSKRRIVHHKRWAGIIIDICYDHFLTKNWALFSNQKLEQFVDCVYKELEINKNILPANLQQVLPRMIAEDWLCSYKTPAGVGLTFMRIARRLKRENSLAIALDEVMDNYSGIESDFLRFFPEAIAYVEKIRG